MFHWRKVFSFEKLTAGENSQLDNVPYVLLSCRFLIKNSLNILHTVTVWSLDIYFAVSEIFLKIELFECPFRETNFIRGIEPYWQEGPLYY